MAYPAHDETTWVDTAPDAEPAFYTVKGYAYTGGGRKITRAEVSLDSGATWMLADIDRPEKPTKYGRYVFRNESRLSQLPFTVLFLSLPGPVLSPRTCPSASS